MRTKSLSLTLTGLFAVLLSGCATLQFPWSGGRFPQASASNPVVRVVCLWEPAEGRDPDGLPCRGFAGQILFLSNRHAMPVQVDGDVRIYLFDDVGTPEEQGRPLHQFDFTSGAWQAHLSKSAVGPSYSVFIPYTRKGQYNAKCTLRLRLHPKAGPVIFSDATTLPLRAPSADSETTVISGPVPAQDALRETVNATMSQALKKTSTIPLTTTNSGAFAVAAEQPSASDADERLSRMEQLLAETLAEKSGTTSPASPIGSVIQAGHEAPAPEAETESEPSRRIKLKPAKPSE